MLKLVVCAALIGLVMSDCGPLQQLKVKQQWGQVYGNGKQREAFGQAVWRAFFKIEPLSLSLFENVNGKDVSSPEFKAHAARVLGGIDIAISLLGDDSLDAELTHLHTQHLERHVPAGYFKSFGTALKAVIPAALGRCFDREAFDDCFTFIADRVR